MSTRHDTPTSDTHGATSETKAPQVGPDQAVIPTSQWLSRSWIRLAIMVWIGGLQPGTLWPAARSTMAYVEQSSNQRLALAT
jgi:hypothetical protein